MTAYDGVFVEQSATPVVRKVALAHLSIELGHLYISEEVVGIWKFDAEPVENAKGVLIDKTGSGGRLTADVEGLTIAYGKDGAGYLLASSQGNNSFIIQFLH